jgi:hypothetical protein
LAAIVNSGVPIAAILGSNRLENCSQTIYGMIIIIRVLLDLLDSPFICKLNTEIFQFIKIAIAKIPELDELIRFSVAF